MATSNLPPLLLASKNSSKIAEVRAVLGVDIQSLLDIPQLASVELLETGKTYQENSLQKALQVAHHFSGLILADDSGLEVEALDGQPGVHSKRWVKGNDNDRIQALLQSLSSFSDRRAQFVTVLCLYNSLNDQSQFFTGVMVGKISRQTQGDAGFGYDPIFIPEGFNRTVAQMGDKIKNQISHRSIALQKLKKYLQTRYRL